MSLRLPLLILVGSLSCASGRVGTRQDGSPACGVTGGGSLMSRTVSVARGTATFYGGLIDREVARLDGGSTITRIGLWNSEGGHCRGGRLVIKGFFSDTTSEPIRQGQVALPGIFSPTIYSYTSSCSTCEAALGAYAVWLLESEAAAQQQQQNQQQLQQQQQQQQHWQQQQRRY